MKKRSASQTPSQRTVVSSKNKGKPSAAVPPAQPSAAGIKRARLIAALEKRALNAFRADQVQARRDLIRAFTQGSQEALEKRENSGYQAEVQNDKDTKRSQAKATRNQRTQRSLQQIVDDGGEHVWLPPRREEIPVIETLPDETQRTRTVLRLHREKSGDALLQRITRRYPTAEHLAHASTDLAQKTGQHDDAYNHARQRAVEGLYAEYNDPFLQALRQIGPQLLSDPELTRFVQGWWVTALNDNADYEDRRTAGRNMDAFLEALDVRGSGNTRKFQEQARKVRNRQSNVKSHRAYAIRQYVDKFKNDYQESKAKLEREGKATASFLRQQLNALIGEETPLHAGPVKREALEQFKQWAEKDITQTMREN